MGVKIDKTRKIGYNNFGSKIIITKYINAHNVDIYFPEYNWTARNTRYEVFKKGNIRCPYEPRIYNHGYLGEGKYKVSENKKLTKCYSAWNGMLRRCYDNKYKEKHLTYEDCEVCDEWLNIQNFGVWFDENYYEIKDGIMCLDKDILHKDNKIYSPENCVFVPHNINVLFTKRDNYRGEYPIGVCYNKRDGNFASYCSIYNFEENKSKSKHLGYYNTPQQAFSAYKQFKEQYIKQVADYYKDQIPQELYNALYNYEVDIDD